MTAALELPSASAVSLPPRLRLRLQKHGTELTWGTTRIEVLGPEFERRSAPGA